jgi:hypothetical protein
LEQSMGDVLDFKRPAPKPKRKKAFASDNLAYPTEQDQRDAQALADIIGRRGVEVEIVNEDDGA